MSIFAVLAEDDSDAKVLETLVKRILSAPRTKVWKKGFHGCGDLCKGALGQVKDFLDRGATHFVICHDSDGQDPGLIKQRIRSIFSRTKVIEQTAVGIIVPVEEIEAWFIADEEATRRVKPSFRLTVHVNPEAINKPKQWQIRESKKGRTRPLYDPSTYNIRVAQHLNLETVNRKCNSFREFYDFVCKSAQSA